MKTEAFKKAIGDHLNQLAETDSLFKETMAKPAKNLEDCVTYIINQVKKTGENVFADAEIFGMAVHYYDEDDIETGPVVKGVSVSHGTSKKHDASEPVKKPAKKNIMDEIQPHLF